MFVSDVLSIDIMISIQLVFNLNAASQWVEEYNNFSFRSFYNFVIDFFESDKHADTLLRWWNKCALPCWLMYVTDIFPFRQVFPNHIATVVKSRKSRTKLIAQRQARARPDTL
jgi:hypothetical protein